MKLLYVLPVLYALASAQPGHGALVLDDALRDATTGTRSGGAFVAGGWQVTGKDDTIYWHVPTIAQGAAEFDVRGLQPNEHRAGMEDKTELFHMYDHTVGNADRNYTGGYRDNAFKHFIRKIGALDTAKANAMEILWQIRPNYEEPDTARLAWDANTPYHFREEWGSDGAGKSVLKIYRDGQLLLSTSVAGAWQPVGHTVRIGASPRRDSAAGAPVGAIFSNVKVWDLSRGTNLVLLNGKSLCDETGPFLGLGVSYFQALRHVKYDRERLNRNLALFAAKGFNYVRILSMVSWDGLEIAPVTFTNRAGRVIAAWSDYWQQFRDLLDLVAQHRLRAEVTIFADAQYVMPSKATRQVHLDGILANIAGRESQLLHLEVANEAWQNGFPGAQGIADLRAFAQHLTDRTSVLVAITSNDDTSDHGIVALYGGSAADLATIHFSRDTRTPEGGWLPVRDVYRAGNLPGVPPVSSNEPIGPGSSVSSESDPMKLCGAAVFAYLANLPAYVFHSSAGVYARVRFEDTAGIDAFQFIRRVLPGDLASWTRHDGLEASSPFTVYCDGQPNRYWPEVKGATNGCHRNIGSAKASEFVCFPMGILSGGVTLEARRPVQFQVIQPLTGAAVSNLTRNGGERFTLAQGPGAYILKGTYLTKDARRNDGRDTPFAAGHLVDDLFFLVEPEAEREVDLLVDEVVLITLRSSRGDPTKVVLSGKGWDSPARNDDILHIARCEGVTIADLTFTNCRSYGIKVEAENAPRDIHIYNCHFRDIGVRAIKGSAGQNPNVRAVKGSVRYCTFENTKVPPADWLFGGDYIAAIDMMALEDWTFSDNLFRNVRGRNGGGRAAIFIWVRSRQVVVERNLIVDCDRGVAFGNPGQSTANLAGERLVYVADSIIRNNMIAGGPDCGIELWYAEGLKVQHNTIWRPERNWRRGIRIGTGTAHTEIVNNLVHGEILLEGGAADLRTNLSGRLDDYFIDPSFGNLALTSAATRAIDQGVPLPDVTEDIRQRSRTQRPDLGAWEFETGDPSAAGAAPATSLGNASVRYTVPDKPYVVLKHGGLEAVVVDNRAVDDAELPGHRAGYHGIASLRHARQPRNLLVPAYAGLNFEHIHDGTVKPREVLFEPRHAPMELRVLNDRTAELYQAPTPYWGLESCMRYQLVMRAAYLPVDGPGDAASVREQIHRFVQQRRPNQ